MNAVSSLPILARPTTPSSLLRTHLQHVQEAPVLHQLRADVKQLGHTDGGGLAHIGVIVLGAGMGAGGNCGMGRVRCGGAGRE